MKKIIIIFTFIFCATIITACGNEIDDTAYVIAIGADGSGGGYTFTFAIGNPSDINSAKGDGAPLIFETQTADDIFTAADKAGARLGKRVELSHAGLLVMGRNTAEKNAAELLGALSERLSQRPQLDVAVTGESAEQALYAINPTLEGNPEKYLKKIFESKETSVSAGVSGREFLCRTKIKSVGTAVPCIENNGGGAEVNSLSVFSGNEYKGSVTDIEIYKILCGGAREMTFGVANRGTLALNSRAHPRIKAECGGKLKISVDIALDGAVASINDGIAKAELYGIAEAEIERRATELLRYSSREVQTDFLHLDEAGRRCFLTIGGWEEYDWDGKYKTAEFDVSVKIFPEKALLSSEHT